jgi:hypothetical protein
MILCKDNYADFVKEKTPLPVTKPTGNHTSSCELMADTSATDCKYQWA